MFEDIYFWFISITPSTSCRLSNLLANNRSYDLFFKIFVVLAVMFLISLLISFISPFFFLGLANIMLFNMSTKKPTQFYHLFLYFPLLAPFFDALVFIISFLLLTSAFVFFHVVLVTGCFMWVYLNFFFQCRCRHFTFVTSYCFCYVT